MFLNANNINLGLLDSLSVSMLPAPLEILGKSPLHIGVLLPESTLYPGMGKSWIAGAQLILDQGDSFAGHCRIILVPEDTGFTTGTAIGAIKKLIKDRIKIITGMISPCMASGLQNLFDKNQVFLIMGSLGANVSPPVLNSPFIFRHTLNTWQGAWAMGEWAARELGSRGMIISSFYESGFDTLQAFRSGFEFGNGDILESFVTDAPIGGAGQLKHALDKIRKKKPDLVFAAFSGKPAAQFLKAYADYGLAEMIPLIGTGMMTDSVLLKSGTYPPVNILTPSAWSIEFPAYKNSPFISDFKKCMDYYPDVFALLGYETMGLVTRALNTCNGDLRSKESFAKALDRVEFSSPRGRIFMDPITHTTTGPVYLIKTTFDINGLTDKIIGRLPVLKESDKLADVLKSEKRSGWINLYMNV